MMPLGIMAIANKIMNMRTASNKEMKVEWDQLSYICIYIYIYMKSSNLGILETEQKIQKQEENWYLEVKMQKDTKAKFA